MTSGTRLFSDSIPDTVETIEISGAARLRFRREDTGWSIVEPLETGADDPQVSALLRAIDFARATGFADPDIVDAETGLEPPRWRIVLNDADANHELLVGGQGARGYRTILCPRRVSRPGLHHRRRYCRDGVRTAAGVEGPDCRVVRAIVGRP